MGSIALTVLTLTLGAFFVFVGQFKVTPKFFPEIHEDMVTRNESHAHELTCSFFQRREFGRVNKVFPLFEQTGWRPLAKNYRMAVGIAECVCGAILVLIPGRLKQLANVVLLIIMLGAVYTHYILHDKFERIAPGLVFSLLLLTRLIIHRQVTQREKRLSAPKKPVGQESDDEESESDADANEDKRQAVVDKKKNK